MFRALARTTPIVPSLRLEPHALPPHPIRAGAGWALPIGHPCVATVDRRWPRGGVPPALRLVRISVLR